MYYCLEDSLSQIIRLIYVLAPTIFNSRVQPDPDIERFLFTYELQTTRLQQPNLKAYQEVQACS